MTGDAFSNKNLLRELVCSKPEKQLEKRFPPCPLWPFLRLIPSTNLADV